MKIEVNHEHLDEIVANELRNYIKDMQYALDNPDTFGIFTHKRKKDVKLIKKHIKAGKRVLSYFSV